MEFEKIADELYGLPLDAFTATRDERAAQARTAGDRQLADSVKRLRKPSTGAWITNMLVRERPTEIERLITRGAALRSTRELDGAQIRQATRDKAEIVAKLLRQARSLAARVGLALSKSVEQELEATLDAAFSDTGSAESLRRGRLTAALRYSGLGFGSVAKSQDPATSSGARARGRGNATSAATAKAKDDLEQARSEADRAASDVEKAKRAVRTAQIELTRQKAALTVAQRRAKRANERASDARGRLDLVRDKTRRA